ncbi:MAG: NADH-quinone oxidoreductase subunit L, partial [Thermoleophilaceae bacterium]
MNVTDFGWVVLGAPLVGTLLIALGWRALPGRSAGWLGSASIGVSFLASLGMLTKLVYRPEESRALVGTAYTYLETAGFRADLSILVDPLSVFMCLVVSGVSFLIHLYSISYMTS